MDDLVNTGKKNNKGKQQKVEFSVSNPQITGGFRFLVTPTECSKKNK